MGFDAELFQRWADEVKNELWEARHHRERMERRLTTLEAEVRTRNKIIWALLGLLVAAAGVVVALVAIQHSH